MSDPHPAVLVRQKGGLPAGIELPEYPPEAAWVYHFSEDPTITEFAPRPVKSNPDSEPLVFIEVQTGEYFGEDDIERLDDDFGRG